MIWRGSRTSKSPTECTDFCRFLTIYSPFYGSRLYFGKGQGYLWKKNASKCQKSSIWSPFLLEDWVTLLLRWTKFFRVYFLCPFCVKNVLFWDTYFLLGQADQFLYQGWELFVQEFGTGLNLYSQPLQISKKCHENENAVLLTAKWLRILMHPIDAFKFWIYWCTRSKMSGCT